MGGDHRVKIAVGFSNPMPCGHFSPGQLLAVLLCKRGWHALVLGSGFRAHGMFLRSAAARPISRWCPVHAAGLVQVIRCAPSRGQSSLAAFRRLVIIYFPVILAAVSPCISPALQQGDWTPIPPASAWPGDAESAPADFLVVRGWRSSGFWPGLRNLCPCSGNHLDRHFVFDL